MITHRLAGTVLVFLGLGLLVVPARGQEARLLDRLPHGTAVAVQQLIDSVAATLPTEPLIKKALEGQSKGADSARILVAVRGLAAYLASARQALGPAASEPDLVAGAAALRAGATQTSLGTLRSLRDRRPVSVALSVYADLLTSGIPADRAWSEVRALAERRVPDSEFLALRDRVAGGRDPTGRSLPPAPHSDGLEHPSP
ncbi:MAG: hypothetical protein ABJC74_03090 [Gemmatimonadota bacterium]